MLLRDVPSSMLPIVCPRNFPGVGFYLRMDTGTGRLVCLRITQVGGFSQEATCPGYVLATT
jgi:hypothetical protein